MVSRYVVLFALLGSTTARADEGIALEVYTGARSADAARLVTPVLDELARSKFSTGNSASSLITGISTPAFTDTGMPANFAAEADAGLRLYAQGNFGAAIQKLMPLIDVAQRNSGAFAKDSKLGEPLQKAMIALALAYSRNGDQGAMHAQFDEMIRSFPNVQVSRTLYGPEAAQAFEDSRKALAARGTGRLIVRVTSGVVFVDETYRGSGDMTLDVPPGDYRVLVIANNLPSRTHNVSVAANSERTVVVDADFDQTIHTGSWTGFLFATAAAREAHEAEYASALAHAVGAQSVALVGLDQVKSGPVVVGSLVSLEHPKDIRRATISLNPDPSRDRLKDLAHFLTGGEPAKGIDVVDVSKEPAHLQPPGDNPAIQTPELRNSDSSTVDTRWGGWRWLSLGVTVGLGATSATLFALNGRCKGTPPPQGRTCNDVYDNSPYDKYTAIAAIPFAALTVYLFATQTKTVDARTAYLVPVDHGAVAGYAFTW